METKQNVFTFTGLGWLVKGKGEVTVSNVEKRLNKLTQYGISWKLVIDKNGTRLEISGYDSVIEDRLCDDFITFVVKYRFIERGNNEETWVDEDQLILITIDNDMYITAKIILNTGDVANIDLCNYNTAKITN